MSDEKKCPSCAEMIKSEAVKCRFCGHDFAPAPIPHQQFAAQSPKSGMKVGKGCLIALGVVFGLVVLGALLGPRKPSGPTTAEVVSAQVAPRDVTAVELERAYTANEAAAQSAYGKQVLRVSATIASIDLGLGDEPFLVLKGEGFMGPQAHLNDDAQARASSLSKGQKVVLVCQEVSEVVGTPMLKDCSIE